MLTKTPRSGQHPQARQYPPTTQHPPAPAMPQLFELGGDVISFAGGLPDLSALPLDDISAQLARLTRLGGRTLLQYSTPHVAKSLVPAIADLMACEGLAVPAEQLVPTSGSQMGLVTVALSLGRPGEVVLCETPAYPGATSAFRTAGLELAGVATDEQGLHPEALRVAVQQVRGFGATVNLVYANPTFANPTGATMSLARRESVLQVCAELGLIMVEDNPYGLLGFDGSTAPACASIDRERVVYLGTFSKVFAPGLRCGWIAAPTQLARQLRQTAEIMALSPSAMAQAALAAFHSSQGWSPLIDAYRASYAQRCGLMSGALTDALGADSAWTWQQPAGGFYLWLRHRDGADVAPYADRAAQAGVSFVPGRHFSIDNEHAHALRLCFSYPPRDAIIEGVRRLSAALTGPVTA